MRGIPAGPCLSLIHGFEGSGGTFEATRTQDPAGNWEIGWSHKLTGMFDPLWNATIADLAQADTLALQDLTTAAQGVCDALEAVVDDLTDGQYGALIDFTYNVGVGAFANSTLCRLVKNGAHNLVPAEFMKWVHANVDGVETVLAGLVRRRKAEVTVWLATT